MNSINNISIIGTGNVALELCKLFFKNNYIIDGIYGRNRISDTLINNELYIENYENIPSKSDLYVIAVRDDSYPEILSKIKLKNAFIVHTSGSLESSSLKSTTKRWGCLYPLQTIKKIAL